MLMLTLLTYPYRFGAYSKEKIYHPEDLEELITYAKIRGVKILFEIDAPSHAGNGWQWGPEAGLGELAVCVNKEPYRSYCIQPPCGQLNPINPNVYKVLSEIYRYISSKIPHQSIFHMGGDELFIPCWNSTDSIIEYLKNRTTESFLSLWSFYQENALKAYDDVVGHSNDQIILWTSHLTGINVIENFLPKNR